MLHEGLGSIALWKDFPIAGGAHRMRRARVLALWTR